MIESSGIALRRLGLVELYFASRHHIGLYRAVITTARYIKCNLTKSSEDHVHLSPPFLHALCSVIRAQPMLHVGIQNEASNDAHFVHLPRMDVSDHVSIVRLQCNSDEELNAEISRRQALEHNRLWEQPELSAPWRLTLILNESENIGRSEDLMFSFHHSLMDGKSGMVFHQLLLASLGEELESQAFSNSTLSFPNAPDVPDAQESMIPFSLTARYMAGLLWHNLAPSILKPMPQQIWSGEPISFSVPYYTGLSTLDFSASTLQTLRVACRKHKTTVTGLLHALVFAALTRVLAENDAMAYSCATPVSLRDYCREKLFHPTDDVLRVLVCSIDHNFSTCEKSKMRKIITSNCDKLDGEIWKTAKRIRSEIVANCTALPCNSSVTTLKYIGDFQSYWAKKNGKPRSNSWECSNIGSFDKQYNGKTRHIERIMFSNGATATGSAIGVNVASVDGGPLTVVLSWQQGIVCETVIRGLRRGIIELIHDYANIKKWQFRSN